MSPDGIVSGGQGSIFMNPGSNAGSIAANAPETDVFSSTTLMAFTQSDCSPGNLGGINEVHSNPFTLSSNPASAGTYSVCLAVDGVTYLLQSGVTFSFWTTPTAPQDLQNLTVTSSIAVITWTPPTQTGFAQLTEYKVSLTPNNGTAVIVVPASYTNVTVTGLSDSTTYSVSVVANNPAGDGPAVSASSLFTTGPPTVPGPVTGYQAVSTATTFAISWDVPEETGGTPITQYYIVVSQVGGSFVTSKIANQSPVTVTGLTYGGISYTVQISATSSVGTGPAVSFTAITTRNPPSCCFTA